MSVEAQRAGGRAADPHRSKSLLSDVAPCRRDMSRGATVSLHAERCSIISVVPLYLSVCVCVCVCVCATDKRSLTSVYTA